MNAAALEAISGYSTDPGLPEGWVKVPLESLFEVNPRKVIPDDLEPGSLITFVPMSAVDAERGTIAAPESRPLAEVTKGYTAFREGDVIVAKITPCFENGKAAIARGLVNGVGFGSTEFHVLRSTGVVMAEYVYHFVRQERFRQLAAGEMTGTVGQKRLPADFLREVVLPVPPPAEQRRIVAAVEVLLERVNATRERLAKLPAILRRFRQAVLAAACTGRLTEEWRLQHDREASPDDSPAAEGARLQLDNLPEWPEIPAKWRLTTIGDVAAELRYGANSKAGSNASGGVPILRMGNIQDGHLDLADLKYVPRRGLEAFGLRYGDILFNRTNSPELVGKAAVFDHAEEMVFASYLIRVRTDPDRLVPRYLCWWINSGWGRAWARAVRSDGVSQSNINATKLASMPLPLPSPSEQQEIVRRVEALFGLAQVIERRVAAATARAERLTQAILAKAFRGELAPTEAELARREGREYEDAGVLVERITREGQASSLLSPVAGREERSR